MTTDLIALIRQQLTPERVQQLAETLEVDFGRIKAAIEGGVPALLIAIADAENAPALAAAVNQQAFEQLAFGSGSHMSLVEDATRLVGAVLGTNAQTGLAAALSTFSGLGQSTMTAVLGALAPVVLGTIGRLGGSQGFDGRSLRAFLAVHEDDIVGAMPMRLEGLLRDFGMLAPSGGVAAVRLAAATGPRRRWYHRLVPSASAATGR